MDQQANPRFDALMKLAEFRRQYRDARRAIEWRVTIAAWALIVGIATTLGTYPRWAIVILVAWIFVGHFTWVRWHFFAAERDAKKMWDHYDAARKLIDALEPDGPPQPKTVFRHFPAFAAIFVTAILGVIVIGLSFLAPSKPLPISTPPSAGDSAKPK